MCGRYSLYGTSDRELQLRYNLATRPTFPIQDSYNVAPRQRLPVIIEHEDGQREAAMMQWGFIPPWSKDPSEGLRPINTKAETAFASPMWRSAVRQHRALIPARGFYEWQPVADGKVPYYIHPRDVDLFSFAGIYSVWKDGEGVPLYTFSMLTTAPNKDMEPIHNRMPVIVQPDQEAIWLDPQYREPDQLAALLVPYEDGELDIYRVSKAVSSPQVNEPELIQPVGA